MLTPPRLRSNLFPLRFSTGPRQSSHPAPWARLQSIWRGWHFSSSSVQQILRRQGQPPPCFADVILLIGVTRLDLLTASPTDLRRATHVSLTFDDQKNRERGEVIAHGRSGHTVACRVLTTIHRVLFLRAQHLPVTSPLCTYVDSRPTTLTSASPHPGPQPDYAHPWCLHPTPGH